jgi:hypothetical protein
MTLPLVQLVFAAFEVVIRSIATTTNTEANPRFLRHRLLSEIGSQRWRTELVKAAEQMTLL